MARRNKRAKNLKAERTRKAQSALEYLMIYSWAMLLAAVIVAVLYFFLFTSSAVAGTSSCTFSGGAYCQDVIFGSNAIQSSMALFLTNPQQYSIAMPQFQVNSTNFPNTTVSCSPDLVLPGGAIICNVSALQQVLTVGSSVAGKMLFSMLPCPSSDLSQCQSAQRQTYTGSFSTHVAPLISSTSTAMTLSANPLSPAANGDAGAISATVKIFGVPVAGAAVSFTQSNTFATIAPPIVTTDGNGNASSYISSMQTGYTLVTAKFAGISANVLINFIAPAYVLVNVPSAGSNGICSSQNSGAVALTIDSNNYTCSQFPLKFSYQPMVSHSYSFTSPVSGPINTRYSFNSIAGCGTSGQSGNFPAGAPGSNCTINANYSIQYYLTMLANPTNGGTTTPATGGWYNSGSITSIGETPNSGYFFFYWNGTGTGSYTGSSTPHLISISNPITEQANFQSIATTTSTTTTSTSTSTIIATMLALRPLVNGTYQQFDTVSPSNWVHANAVNEINPDDAASYIEQLQSAGTQIDTFTHPASGIPAGSTINYVALYVRGQATQIGSHKGSFSMELYTHGNLYAVGSYTDPTWLTHSNTWTTNPYTGSAWTISDVDNSEIGAGSVAINYCVHGNCGILGGYVTNIWMVVNYTPPSPTTSTSTSTTTTSIGSTYECAYNDAKLECTLQFNDCTGPTISNVDLACSGGLGASACNTTGGYAWSCDTDAGTCVNTCPPGDYGACSTSYSDFPPCPGSGPTTSTSSSTTSTTTSTSSSTTSSTTSTSTSVTSTSSTSITSTTIAPVPYIYCVGTANIGPMTQVYYAPVSSTGVGTWASSTSYPVGMYDAGCSISSGYIYCVGSGSSPTNGVYYAPVSSTGMGTWMSTTTYPIPMIYAGCSISNGYIYCVGTYSSIGSYTRMTYYAPISSTGVGTWASTTNYPVPMYHAGCSISNGYIYCVGTGGTSSYTEVYYAPISSTGIGTWASTTNYPVPMYHAGCSISNGYIYCAGTFGTSPYTQVYYAPVSSTGVGTWKSATAYPLGLYGAGCSISNGYIYCVGTFGNYYDNQVYYAPVSSTGVGTWISSTNYPVSMSLAYCQIPGSGGGYLGGGGPN